MIEDEDIESMPLEERVFDRNWKVRIRAYKQVHDQFYEQYCKDSTGKQQPNDEEEEQSSFVKYGPLLETMIKDQNLAAQYEGLNCLFAYVQYCQDIKSIMFSCHNYLIEKIQHTKPNLREITNKILTTAIRRGQASYLVPELTKRFSNKNTKISQFVIQVMVDAFLMRDIKLIQEEFQLKNIFKQLNFILTHDKKEFRSQGHILIQEIFQYIVEDPQQVVNNIKGLRPVQQKEILEMLGSISKNEVMQQKEQLVMLFDSSTQNVAQPQVLNHLSKQNSDDQSYNAQNQGASDYSGVNRDHSQQNKGMNGANQGEPEEIDLSVLVPENFQEISYIQSINVKRKSMEQFNSELDKIVKKPRDSIIIKQKDYSQLFNIVQHLLEEPNMLVFMEAIKSVQNLCILLGSGVKQAKQKQFIQLLCSKFKETKTSIIKAVNEALSQFVKSKCMSTSLFVDFMINTVSSQEKNSRVKQFTIDNVEQLLKFQFQQTQSVKNQGYQTMGPQQSSQLFKSSRESIMKLIQKDTNNNVRDSAVTLLTTFKMLIQANCQDLQLVNEAVNSLPKYRQQEINNNVEQQLAAIMPASSTTQEEEQQKQQQEVQHSVKPQVQSQEQQRNIQQQNMEEDISQSSTNLDSKQDLHKIIAPIKKMHQGYTVQDHVKMQQVWDDCLERMGEQGIRESKPVIVQYMFWLLTHPQTKLDFSQNQSTLESIIILLKRLYCMERSVQRQEDGRSLELYQSLNIAFITLNWAQNTKQSILLLNVVYSASGNIQSFVDNYRQALLDTLKNIKVNNWVLIIEIALEWVGKKMKDLINLGAKVDDLHNLLQIPLSSLQQNIPESEKKQLIKIIGDYKACLSQFRPPTAQNQNLNKENMMPGQQTNTGGPTKLQQPNLKSLPDQILEKLLNDFESGLVLLKDHTQNAQKGLCDPLSFQVKSQIFEILLKYIEGQQGATQQELQYKQAYSLKALMWMKENLLGIEDSFKLSSQVIQLYCKVTIELKKPDCSVEAYLMNFWMKDLSLRDNVDRVSYCYTLFQNLPAFMQQQYFILMFKWLVSERLPLEEQKQQQQNNGQNTKPAWTIDDFRKISLSIAKMAAQVEEKNVIDFIDLCTRKFSKSKVREFMEIQLMHSNDLYMKFIDWFEQRYPSQEKAQNQQVKIKNALNQQNKDTINTDIKNHIQNDELDHDNDVSSSVLQSIQQDKGNDMYGYSAHNKSQNTSYMPPSTIQSYQERRQQRQHNKQQPSCTDLEQSQAKYDEILGKLEKDFQNKQKLHDPEDQEEQKRATTQQSQQHQIFNKTSKSQFDTSHCSNRYEVDNEDDSVINHSEIKGNLNYLNENLNSNSEIATNGMKQQPSDALMTPKKSIPQEPSNQLNEMNLMQLNELSIQEEQEHLKQSINKQTDRLMESQIKESKYRKEVDQLMIDKQRIELQKKELQLNMDKESHEFKVKMEQMQGQQNEVMQRLSEANQCYLQQVSENEDLRKQIQSMQQANQAMMKRFQEIESKISSQGSTNADSKVNIVNEEKMQELESVFKAQTPDPSHQPSDLVNIQKDINQTLGIQKIQELLINTQDNVMQNLGNPLILMYQNIKSEEQRKQIVLSLKQSLQNEDILYALNVDVYKTLLHFMIKVFSIEKETLEAVNSSQSQTASMKDMKALQNEITQESQRVISTLLNSREFTTSLVSLFQLLQEAMPNDLSVHLSIQEKQYLRVVIRCIQRLTKALHSENPDLIRAFDVLVEMQRLFVKHPPEQLSENLPCLQDFDYLYTSLKEVSDKLVDLQPDKILSFLNFCKDMPPNAFYKYLERVMFIREQRQKNQHMASNGLQSDSMMDNDTEAMGDYYALSDSESKM